MFSDNYSILSISWMGDPSSTLKKLYCKLFTENSLEQKWVKVCFDQCPALTTLSRF